MTAPRQVLPGATYLVTRRCALRQFLLRPSKLTNDIFLYVLALAAGRYDVQIHAFCVMSNHFHLVVTDPFARLPAFEQYLDGLVARAMNASLGRWEAFWAPSSYSAVVLSSPEDVIEKVAYVLANPVAAGLVQSGREWPGLWSAPELLGGGRCTAARPSTFFRSTGAMPATAHLALAVPRGFESREAFLDKVRTSLARAESTARKALGSAARFLGRARVLMQSPRSRPATLEPRRQLNPRVAAQDRWKRIETLQRLAEFIHSYRRAWRARRAGDALATFPAGTYLMRVLHLAPCAPS